MSSSLVDEVREQLTLASRRAYASGLQTGNGGNVSARYPGGDRMLVTASGGSFGDCTPEAFLVTDFDGNLIEGKGKATREALMHGRVYASRPDVGAIMHAHAPYAVAMSEVGEDIPRVTWHSRLKLAAPIRVLDVPSPMVREQDWHLVEECLNQYPGISAFVLRGHGIVAFGPDPIEACHLADLIEETAKIAFLSLQLGSHPAATAMS